VSRTSTYPLLDDEQSAQSYPIPVAETTDIGRDTVSRSEWQYYVTPATGRVGKKLKVSGEPVVAVELNRQTESQVLFSYFCTFLFLFWLVLAFKSISEI
jgi:hypothetical protein